MRINPTRASEGLNADNCAVNVDLYGFFSSAKSGLELRLELPSRLSCRSVSLDASCAH